MRRAIVFCMLLLFVVCGCAGQNAAPKQLLNVQKFGNDFKFYWYGSNKTLLTIDNDYKFIGKSKQNNALSYYEFSNGVGTVYIYDAFFIREHVPTINQKGTEEKSSGFTIKTVEVGQHPPNGQFFVEVTSQHKSGSILYNRLHADVVEGGSFQFFYCYAENLDNSHAYELWPNDISDKETYLQSFIARAKNAVRIFPKLP